MSFKILEENLLFRYIEEPGETKVIIPDGLEIIGCQSFFRSRHLESVTIPPSVKKIEPKAFEYCYDLKEVRITHAVGHIDRTVFYECRELKTLIWQGIPIPVTGYLGFYLPDIVKILYQQKAHGEVSKHLKHVNLPLRPKYGVTWAIFYAYPENQKIIHYIQKELWEMLMYLINENLIEILYQALQSEAFVNANNIDELIRYAIEQQKYEIQMMLISYKHEHFGYQDIADKLKL